MTVRLLHLIAIVVAIVGLSACGSPIVHRAYQGAALPLDQVSVLNLDRQTWIESVDAKATGITSYNPGESGVQLELAPGRHVLVISYSTLLMSATPSTISSTQIFSRSIPIDFDFRKGRRYELHYRTLDNRFTFDIVDVTDGGSRKTSLATWGRY